MTTLRAAPLGNDWQQRFYEDQANHPITTYEPPCTLPPSRQFYEDQADQPIMTFHEQSCSPSIIAASIRQSC